MAKDKLNVKDRDIAVPGQILAEGMDYLPSGKAVRTDNGVVATTIGLVSVKGRVLKVIPLSGRYSPRRDDTVVGIVTEIGKYGWRVNINAPYDSEINVRDASSSFTNSNNLSRIYRPDDFVLASITEITDKKYIKLSTKFRPNGLLRGGVVIEVSPSKIPRIIGREGSMIRTLKDEGHCDIFVGQNGWVWIKGDAGNVALVSKAIRKIESDSHTKGLTEEVKKILKGAKKSKPKKETESKGGKK